MYPYERKQAENAGASHERNVPLMRKTEEEEDCSLTEAVK